MITKIFLYIALITPLITLALIGKSNTTNLNNFVLFLYTYLLLYHPTVTGIYLVSKKIIRPKDFILNFIPFWNLKYYKEIFF